MIVSQKSQLIVRDIESWGKTALLFMLPVLALYISFVLGRIDENFTWSIFIPTPFIQGAMVSYVLNEILALIKKFREFNKYPEN